MQFNRESIVKGSFRAFCVTFSALIGIFIAIVFAFLILSTLESPDMLPPKASIVIAEDAEGRREILPNSSPVVLRFDIHGVIGLDDLTTASFESLLLDSREAPFEGNRVKAILLHIDTPGGTVGDSDGIYRALVNYKKKYNIPIYAFVSDLCASGGMYIAVACDKIFASPVSVVGSVGVRMGPIFNVADTMQQWGIKSTTLTAGKDKDMLNPFRPWVDGEDACLKTILTHSYEQFVDLVTQNRPTLNKDKLIAEYGAQVYSAETALALGFIDKADSSYAETLKTLTQAANIKEDERYQVIKLVAPRNFIDQWIHSSSAFFQGKIRHSLDLGPLFSTELQGKPLYLYYPSR